MSIVFGWRVRLSYPTQPSSMLIYICDDSALFVKSLKKAIQMYALLGGMSMIFINNNSIVITILFIIVLL